MAGLCGWALSSSCPPLGRAPELCQLCGWAPWLGLVLTCPPLVLLLAWALWLGLVLLLAAPLNSVNSVAGLCGWALPSSCPAPELCQLCGWALWLGLVLLLAAPLNSVNSVAGLCGLAFMQTEHIPNQEGSTAPRQR